MRSYSNKVRRPCLNFGFTLVELLVGMLVLAIALVMLSSLIFSQGDRASDALFRVRAAELGQSIMNEIWGKRFDENTNPNSGAPCGVAPQQACTLAANFGPDVINGVLEKRNDWNDIDDFNGMTETALILQKAHMETAKTYQQIYPDYRIKVTVSVPKGATSQQSKLISVFITTPNQETIQFDAVRSNF